MQQKNKKPVRSEYLAMALLCVVIVIFIVILIVVSSYKNAKREESAAEASAEASRIAEASLQAESELPPEEESKDLYGNVELASSGKKQGILAITQEPGAGEILETPEGLVTVSSLYNQKFGLSGYSLQLGTDAMSAFNQMAAAFYEVKGKTNIIMDKGYIPYELLTDRNVQLDLMTGNAVLLSIYPADPDKDSLFEGKFSWIPDNCNSYGYIMRHPAEKADKTGVSGSRVMRYVGYAHASYMGTKHYCLEEYLEFLKGFTVEMPLEFTYKKADGTEAGCQVYYCAASDTEKTKVRIPEGANYSYSGNGTDGFIITIYK